MNRSYLECKIAETENKIAELKNELDNLKKEQNKQDGRWKPNINDDYYYINDKAAAQFNINMGTHGDKELFSIGNYFKTEEEAEFELERLKIIEELKEFAFEPNWKDVNQDKYIIEYNHFVKEIDYGMSYCLQSDNIYFETKEDVENAIKKVGEDRIKKYLFGVTEGR